MPESIPPNMIGEMYKTKVKRKALGTYLAVLSALKGRMSKTARDNSSRPETALCLNLFLFEEVR